jgi:hypothetical protein
VAAPTSYFLLAKEERSKEERISVTTALYEIMSTPTDRSTDLTNRFSLVLSLHEKRKNVAVND